MRERKNYTDIKYSTSSFALTPAIKRNFGDTEMEMFNKDMQILNTKQMKNDLEAYAYRMRDICGSYGSHEKYIDPSIKDQYLAQVSQVVDWLYGEGENATLQEYEAKLQQFKEVGEPVISRQWYYTEIDQYFNEFNGLAEHITKRTGEIEHLTEEQKNTVNMKLQNSIEFMGKVKADKESKQLFQEPAYGIDGVVAHLKLLKAETEAIFNAPPPKKEEPKPESKSAEGKKEGDAAEPAPANAAAEDAQKPDGEAEGIKEDVEMKNE